MLLSPYIGTLVPGQRAMLSVVISDWHDPDGSLRLENLAVMVLRIDRFGLAARFRKIERYKSAALKNHYTRKSRNSSSDR